MATRPISGPQHHGAAVDDDLDDGPSTLEMDVDELQSRLKWQASLPVFEEASAEPVAAKPRPPRERQVTASGIPVPPSRHAPMQHLPPRRRQGAASSPPPRRSHSGSLAPDSDALLPPPRARRPPSGSQPRFGVPPAAVAPKKADGGSRLWLIAGVLLGLVVLFGGGMALVVVLQDRGGAQPEPVQVAPAAEPAPAAAPVIAEEVKEEPSPAVEEDAGSAIDAGTAAADAGLAPDASPAPDVVQEKPKKRKRRKRRKRRKKEGPAAPPIIGADHKQAWE